MYVLGVDGGGTKTIAMVADLRGNILGIGTSSASNYQTVGLEKAINAIKEASEDAIVSAGITPTDLSVACLGLAGAGRETDRSLLLPPILELGLARKVILEHDASIALAGATICQPGVVVIAGTGAMAFGMNRSGERRRSGGWGNILGDEGSAYYIGRRALSAACRAYDGRGQTTSLVSALMEHFKLNCFTEIVNKIYGEKSAVQDIAGIAPLVSRVARGGDEVAINILKDAGEELALTANAVINGLGMEDEKFQVAVSGSVFNAGEILLIPFCNSVKSQARYAEIVRPRFEPVVGALFIALRESGVDLSIFEKRNHYIQVG